MSTISVLDSNADPVLIEAPPALGRAAQGLSVPVVLSNEDAASLASILAKLIATPATEAKQDATNTLLTAIAGYVDGIEAGNAAILAKMITTPATEAKQDAETAAVNKVGTRAYGVAANRLAYSGASGQSTAITGTEVLLHNCGTSRCYVKAGSAPTATANDIPIEAGEKFHLRITTGDKIAAIQDSAGGNLNIIPVA